MLLGKKKYNMPNKMEHLDFNLLFWKTIGVNNRVFDIYDVFIIKKNSIQDEKKYKNTQRDKQADEKAYERYLKNYTQSKHAYYWISSNETSIFEHFLYSIMGESKQFDFYYNQFFNLMSNYRWFIESQLPKNMIIDLISFQMAYLIENIVHNKYDVKLFDESLEKKSLQPFIDQCKSIQRVKTNKDLANKMIYIHQKFVENMNENDIYVSPITCNSMQTRLSEWKKNNSLPGMIHLILITNTLEKGISEEKHTKFIQLLLIRALLHMQSKLSNTDNVKRFLDRLSVFRKDICNLYNYNQKDILQFQNNYLVDFSLILKNKEQEFEKKISNFIKKKVENF